MSPRKAVPAVEPADESVEKVDVEAPQWTQEQLLEAKHFGPAIVGEAMWKAAQQVVAVTGGGRFGPALL